MLTAYTDNANCDGHTNYGAGAFNDTYTYSPGGNLTPKTGTGAGTHNGTYTYGDTDHAHAVTATSDGSSFVYNDDGDMTTRNLAGQAAQTLAWNEEHRLAHVESGGTIEAEFIYGLDDTRLRRRTGDTYTYYHRDGSEYTWDNATNTGVFTYYHQIAGRTVAFTTSDDSKTTWMFSDQVSSTALTRDDVGVLKRQRYTPWGETRTDGGLATDHTFTGQVEDRSTGLRFYNARYQDPVLGRFISPDTIVPNPGNGQDYNRYSYVNNRPIIYDDPSGHCPPNTPCYGEILDRRRPWQTGRWVVDSLAADDEGMQILQHYLDGGDDVDIVMDPAWSSYMQQIPGEDAYGGHENRFDLDVIWELEDRLGAAGCSFGSQCEVAPFSMRGNAQNGEGVVGYMYLNNTNPVVGDLEVEPFWIIDNDDGTFDVTAYLTWNDIIDPNSQYSTDVVKNWVAEITTVGRADSYNISITWMETFTVRAFGTPTSPEVYH